MAGGRPVQYSNDTINKVYEYIDLCVDEYDTFHKTRGTTSDSYERLVKVKLPTMEGLALHLGIHKDTLYDWKSKYPEFSDSLGKVMQLQADRLMSNGLSGDYNPTIAKLLLMQHGYREGIDHSTNGKDLPTPILGKYVPTNDNTGQDSVTE